MTKKEDEGVKNEALQILGSFDSLPRLAVFDLDYTLWPFYCECRRSKREMPKLYPEVKGILYALKEKGVDVAIASRSTARDIANIFLEKLQIKSMFVAQEVFSSGSPKTEHFHNIQQRTRVPYNEMLFFDDENRNIEAVSKMGVTSILVSNGVNIAALKEGLSKFMQNLTVLEKTKRDELSFHKNLVHHKVKNKERWAKFPQKHSSSQSGNEEQ